MGKHRGKLIAVGGSMDKQGEILPRMLKEMRGRDSRIEIITSASEIPEIVADGYIEAFYRLGCDNVDVMHIERREDASRRDFLRRIERADGILLSGGDQKRLCDSLNNTDLLDLFQERYRNDNFVICGTSAGAAAMSNIMISGGDSTEALLKGSLRTTAGLNFNSDIIIDTHIIKRGRFSRLIKAVVAYPKCIVLGIGEDTGVIIHDGDHLETIGTGLVAIFDGHGIAHTNLHHVREGDPTSVENVTMHLMVKGDQYDLKYREFIRNRYYSYAS